MSFRLRKDTRDWFKDLQRELDIDFDIYYFCLMAGLAKRRKTEVPPSETTELVQNFPGAYREKGRIIIALFLKIELEELGVKMSQRQAVHDTISRLVCTTSPSSLSDDGEREFNKYAYGGYDVLTEWFDDRPRTLETFLPVYARHLQEELKSR